MRRGLPARGCILCLSPTQNHWIMPTCYSRSKKDLILLCQASVIAYPDWAAKAILSFHIRSLCLFSWPSSFFLLIFINKRSVDTSRKSRHSTCAKHNFYQRSELILPFTYLIDGPVSEWRVKKKKSHFPLWPLEKPFIHAAATAVGSIAIVPQSATRAKKMLTVSKS